MATSSSMACSDDESEKQTTRTQSSSKLLQIVLAFAIVFFPLVFVATLLCLFVTIPAWTIQDPSEEDMNLPFNTLDESFYSTKVLMNRVAVTSSFASNVAQFAAAPFLLLFSFLVALELANRHETTDQDTINLLRGDQRFFFNWTLFRLWRSRNTKITKGTRIAGIGALMSVILTTLLLVGDKVLEGTLAQTTQRVYEAIFEDPDFVHPDLFGSFKLNNTICPLNETIPDIYDENAPPPCSVYGSSPWTLLDAPSAYRVLANGLLNQTGGYNNEDFSALTTASVAGAFDNTQLITHIDVNTNEQHILYFNPWSAEEDSNIQIGSKPALVNQDMENVGLDYIATTTSVVTKCAPITKDCGIYNSTNMDSPIPFRCSDSFYGDLNEIPTNGLERLKGWNTTFFDFNNGTFRKISIASQLNPFSYDVTVVVDSIDIEGLVRFGDPQVPQGVVVEVGDGRVGFAISCNSTVYDVTYSLVNGSIFAFNTTLAAPSTAAIIKAPLQAGFGSYELFEKAAMSVLLSNSTVMDAMELAFSQTFLALAAGVFAPAPYVKQRWRYDMTVTKMGKGPVLFLVVSMFLYALFVVVFTIVALSLFWRRDVREVQARLIS
ncbi:hypothetical protein AG0111_0g2714 [Alternaria gaisen]|uniref:Uncharacterized protein n=1 Tax=Alternaria gaisen TaxID=167740 RepID=A0ACB6FV98_9PLEO|nr:hypothetical protein AG0111_0g2714 [Alternaria gaisen]